MVTFPNCKINIGLHVLNKREDGYHNLETVFYPVNITDVVEMIPNHDPQTNNKAVVFTQSGLIVDLPDEKNICVRAYNLLKDDFPILPSVKLHLHKNIPMGAGLGGGSANAAFLLQMINESFGLHISQDDLIQYGLRLGSDCPFFLLNKPAFATGRGEKLNEIQLDLSSYQLLIVNPGVHINTAWAFGQLDLGKLRDYDLKNAITDPINTWKDNIFNDFEIPVFNAYPEISALKKKMYDNGAVFASMSGSGSSVFGIFDKNIQISTGLFTDNFVKIIPL